jgi:hypothetical protein
MRDDDGDYERSLSRWRFAQRRHVDATIALPQRPNDSQAGFVSGTMV